MVSFLSMVSPPLRRYLLFARYSISKKEKKTRLFFAVMVCYILAVPKTWFLGLFFIALGQESRAGRGFFLDSPHPRLACRLGRFAPERHWRSLTPPPLHIPWRKPLAFWHRRGETILYISFQRGLSPPLTPPFSQQARAKRALTGGARGGGAPPRRGVARGPFPLRGGGYKGGAKPPFEKLSIILKIEIPLPRQRSPPFKKL